jgi:hypothetical protein
MRATTIDLQYHFGAGFKCGAADVELSARVRKACTGRLHDRVLIVLTDTEYSAVRTIWHPQQLDADAEIVLRCGREMVSFIMGSI